ncbi:hypothetical protein BB427_11360 [Pseudoalteromonas sp. BMB]|uniref:hypothetical protein n=1 Tax=Pseudoalteromonas sp. BMB TaxID=1874619 RepID=UPI00083D70D1|nr:hypothetical protein [Pseudoalteromonas sp. BMB]ODB41082.1 hypothetical protein BB427_11360 [Pseudoalteromonas sp. BMB]
MKNQVTDSILHEAIQSAQQGAFFRDSIPDVSETDIENSITWQEYVESFARSNREAQAPQGIEKARLVISCKSQTRPKPHEIATQKQIKERQKQLKLDSLRSGVMRTLSKEKRAEYLGIHDGECLDFDTGEVRPIYESFVDVGHFESPVLGRIEREPNTKSNAKPKIVKPHYQNNRAHFQSRNWSDDFRIVCTQMTSTSDAPDANTGERITRSLTSRARGKIIDSGLYMQAVKGGYSAFLTVTLDEAARKKLDEKHYKKDRGGKEGDVISPWYNANGEKLEFECAENDEIIADGRFTYVKFDFATIGEQLSPFLDSMGKMHKRGWMSTRGLFKEFVKTDVFHNNERLYPWGIVECIEQCEARAITNKKMEICKIECAQDPKKKPVFDYMWVAEAPRKIHESRLYPFGENGELVEVQSIGYQNYHAHMLMRWNVPHHHFREWAERVERLWGKGMVHIERIKSPAAASSYLLKALGYMSSDSKGDQGEIRGNRYNISKYARAEAWENCATHESQHMYTLIQEYLQYLEAKRKRKRKVQNELKETIAFRERIKHQETTTKRERLIERLTAKIEAISNRVESMSKELNGNFARGGVAKFANAREFKRFMDNAIGVRGWRLQTIFSADCDQEHIKQQRKEENAVTKMLIKTQQVIDESIDSVMSFYSRFERISPHESDVDAHSLVTGDIWT